MNCVRINSDGSMNDIEIELKKKNLLKIIENECISKGTTDFKELYRWNYESKEIYCYGWYDGEAGFENKHDLIPNGISKFIDEDSSEKLLFGDIILICMKNKKFINFCVTDYSEIYDILFDFEDLDELEEEDDEEDDEEEDEEDDDFIVKDDEDEESDCSFEGCSDEELDIDENNYSDDEGL